MENKLGHKKDLVLYGSCGNVMYEYKNSNSIIVETFYNISGEIIKQNTHIKNEGKYKGQKRDS